MKKSAFFLIMLLATVLYAQKQEQEFQPFLANVSNSENAQNNILSNTYKVFVGKGYQTAFRIHKNWFLTNAHGPFQDLHKSMSKVGVSVKKRPNAPGHSAPFALVVNTNETGINANGRVYLFNPELPQFDNTNNGRGEDLALIYIPDEDPTKPAFDQANQEFKQVENQLDTLKGLPKGILAGVKNNISSEQKKASLEWSEFLNYPIKPFHLLILSEETVVQELGFPGETSYSFPLTAYFIHKPKMGVIKFNFVPQGTHKGTNAIFYERVTDLQKGTSGSPMTYGNYVVSVDSARNCSPMLTDKFYSWLRRTMGKDYVHGMCVKPEQTFGNHGNNIPVHNATSDDWNQG